MRQTSIKQFVVEFTFCKMTKSETEQIIIKEFSSSQEEKIFKIFSFHVKSFNEANQCNTIKILINLKQIITTFKDLPIQEKLQDIACLLIRIDCWAKDPLTGKLFRLLQLIVVVMLNYLLPSRLHKSTTHSTIHM